MPPLVPSAQVGLLWLSNLAFKALHQERAAVAFFLGIALGVGLAFPLDVILATGEGFPWSW
jgi:hypothetical protein